MPKNEHLRRHRILRNWRQQDIADHLGTTPVTVQRWERGTQQPSAYYCVKLCTLFGLSADELGLIKTVFSEQEAPDEEATKPEVLDPPPAEKLQLWTIPYMRNPHFNGREYLLDQLQQQFTLVSSGETPILHCAALTQAQAIKGLGGIGKTQIALEYAYRAHAQGRYTHTLWINATSEESILQSYSELADLIPSLHAMLETNQVKRVRAVIRWLEVCEQPWLLIADNADELRHIQRYLPVRGPGHILLTTRASAVGVLATPVEVDTMGVMEGTQFLLKRVQRVDASDDETNEAINLTIALGQFPLALDQAGAYIENTGCTISEYHHLYQQHSYELLAQRGENFISHPDPVASTWSLSFEQVKQRDPAAAELLHLCAFLAPDRIPEEFLLAGAPYWPETLQAAVADRIRFNQMVAALLAFSLVKRISDERMLSIHRLVQVVVLRNQISQQEQQQWSQRILLALHALFPSDVNSVESWPHCQWYLEQVQAGDQLMQQHDLKLPQGTDLLCRAGLYLQIRGVYMLAEPLQLRALQIYTWHEEARHSDVARVLRRLGNIYYERGKHTEAEAHFLRGLQLYEQQRDTENSVEYVDTAQILTMLGHVYLNQGKYAQARVRYERALRILESRDPMHLEIARTLGGLGYLSLEQGAYEQARAYSLRALHIFEHHLGATHPDVANALIGLTEVNVRLGEYADAEARYTQALHIRVQYFGHYHQKTAQVLYRLSNLHQKQQRCTEAEPLYQRALQLHEQHFGPDYVWLSDPLSGLANLYTRQGRYEQAEPLYQRALRLREQHFGPENTQTAEILHDLAFSWQVQGRFQRACELYERALPIRERDLGEHTPATKETRQRLAEVLSALQ